MSTFSQDASTISEPLEISASETDLLTQFQSASQVRFGSVPLPPPSTPRNEFSFLIFIITRRCLEELEWLSEKTVDPS